ncbi:MAG: stage II sporulation protein M [Fimbriimonadaceae bacterium]|nr:stage II sporulation protein M [Fimbriimonadaceae bacterium]
MPLKNEEAYLNKRTGSWRRLEELCVAAERTSRLTGDEVVEFVRLYRRTAGDLAYLTTHSSNAQVVEYLNALVARSYSQIYRAPRKGFLQALWEAIEKGAEATYRRRMFVFVSIAIFVLSFLSQGALHASRPDLRTFFVPPEMDANFAGWRSGVHEERDLSMSIQASAFYASNNPRVGITAAAIGAMTAGIGTFAIMWVNGGLIGILSVECLNAGTLGFLYSSILPHGVPELGGAFIAGGIGLMFGWAILVPGNKTRTLAIKEAGVDGFRMLVVALAMIFIAAPIEGFFSFNPAVPQWIKLVFGLLFMVGWISFFRIFGRRATERQA